MNYNEDLIETRIEMNAQADAEADGGRDITSLPYTPSAASAAALVRAWESVFGDQMEAGDD